MSAMGVEKGTVMDQEREADERYARGEIDRDEWVRLRGSGPTAPATPASSPLPAPRNRFLFEVAVVLVAVLVGIAAVFVYLRASSGTNPTYGTPQELTSADLSALNASATAGLSFASNDTLWFRPGTVAFVVYASPPAHDLTFVVQGMVNPTIHLAAGTRAAVTVVNLDSDMYHNWALTSRSPPYSSMPMMSSGTMMTMTMLGHASGGGYWSQAASFTPYAGSYWYLCQYPDHANEGMYGSFVVD